MGASQPKHPIVIEGLLPVYSHPSPLSLSPLLLRCLFSSSFFLFFSFLSLLLWSYLLSLLVKESQFDTRLPVDIRKDLSTGLVPHHPTLKQAISPRMDASDTHCHGWSFSL